MNSTNYDELQAVFSRFNEETIRFYSDLSALVPHDKLSVISGLKQTLDMSNLLFKQVAELLYKQK